MIFCQKCNTALDNDAIVCTNCGTEIVIPVEEPAETVAEETVVDEKLVSKLTTDVLLWGILSLISALHFSPVLGIIFSCIGLNAKKKLKAIVTQIEGNARIGSALSLTALIYSIYSLLSLVLFLGFYILYMAFIIILGISTSFM